MNAVQLESLRRIEARALHMVKRESAVVPPLQWEAELRGKRLTYCGEVALKTERLTFAQVRWTC